MGAEAEQRIKELEQEVKNLTRLVREMAAREKVLTKRLHLVAQDLATSQKAVKALDTAARKSDAKLAQVQGQVQRVSNSR